ncbi:MAG: hypothetical protein FJ293_14395 [Planctomycetes bacterium]|nr:hypothetical protein [Planctomycetota bacterium]
MVLSSLLAPTLLGALAVAADSAAVRGGTVVNPDGTRIEKGVVVIQDGRISAVGGPDTPIPGDAVVHEAEGRVVFPALVLAHTQIGLDITNENVPVAPFVNVYDAIEPNSAEYEDCLRTGIGTVHVIQGNNTVIGGLSRIIRPLGDMIDAMTVRADAGLKVSISPRSGFNRMTQLAELRRAFAELAAHVDAVAEKRFEEEKKKKDEKVLVLPDEAARQGLALVTIDDLDARWRTLWRVSKGEVPLFVHCDRAMDVMRGIDWLKEMKLLEKTTFVVGSEAFKAVEALKAAGRPLVLSGILVHRETDPVTGEIKETFVPKVFADAGVPFVLQPNGFGFSADGMLWYQAARCVREGVARDVAVKAITQSAADAIGMGGELGSLAAGKWGNVAILSGDPLDQATFVDRMLIEGRLAYERATDRRLKELTTGQESPPAAAAKTEAPAAPAEAPAPAPAGDAKPDESKPAGDGSGEQN